MGAGGGGPVVSDAVLRGDAVEGDGTKRWISIPPHVASIFGLFVASRVVLTLIGVVSDQVLRRLIAPGALPQLKLHYSSHLWLDVWGVWDTGHYVGIAQNGYVGPLDTREPNYCFFPLYPMLMRGVSGIIGDPFVAGLVISNVCLLLASLALFRLMRLEENDETAMESVRYLFAFPTAFVLSGVFSEALCLSLVLGCFYFARLGRWSLVGALGFLAALSRPVGVLVAVPMAFEYAKSKRFTLSEARLDIAWLGLIPAGLLAFMAYNHLQTGDAFYFLQTYAERGREAANPWSVLSAAVASRGVHKVFPALFGLTCLVLLTVFIPRIRFSYWLWGMLVLVTPIAGGTINGLPRFASLLFPLPILFATLLAGHRAGPTVMMGLAMLQGSLMVFWSIGVRMMM